MAEQRGKVFIGMNSKELGYLGFVMGHGPAFDGAERTSEPKPFPRAEESQMLGHRINHMLTEDRDRRGVTYTVCASCGSVTRDETEAVGEIGKGMFKDSPDNPSCLECQVVLLAVGIERIEDAQA